MKHELPCAVVQDLLPNYLENLTSEETNKAIAEHLANCAPCQEVYAEMSEKADLAREKCAVQTTQDKVLLQKIKAKLHHRTKKAIVAGVIAAVAIFGLCQVLFNIPLKNVDAADVQVEAKTYSLAELAESVSDDALAENIDKTTTKIYSGAGDVQLTYTLHIPNTMAEIDVTADVMKNNEYLTQISWSSPYFLREILWEDYDKSIEDGILRIKAFKTTFFNNKSNALTYQNTSLEFRKIEKIVFVEKDGSETLLWTNEVAAK